MKQSWQNNIDKAFKYHISVNRHVAKDMLDYIKKLEKTNNSCIFLRLNNIQGCGNPESQHYCGPCYQCQKHNTHRV
jgi:hypothetical protein